MYPRIRGINTGGTAGGRDNGCFGIPAWAPDAGQEHAASDRQEQGKRRSHRDQHAKLVHGNLHETRGACHKQQAIGLARLFDFLQEHAPPAALRIGHHLQPGRRSVQRIRVVKGWRQRPPHDQLLTTAVIETDNRPDIDATELLAQLLLIADHTEDPDSLAGTVAEDPVQSRLEATRQTHQQNRAIPGQCERKQHDIPQRQAPTNRAEPEQCAAPQTT
jgi:hypothetical protein